MQDFDDSTLWRISEFERVRYQTGNSGYVRLGGPTVLPTTLVSELAKLEDVLSVEERNDARAKIREMELMMERIG